MRQYDFKFRVRARNEPSYGDDWVGEIFLVSDSTPNAYREILLHTSKKFPTEAEAGRYATARLRVSLQQLLA